MGEKLKITNLPLSGAVEVQAKPITDDRGWFSRWFCQEELKAINYNRQIEQINSSFTASKGVIRGLHFQFAPNMEDKIVRCIQGSVFDVIVDLRHASPTFGEWHSVVLDSRLQNMLYIPKGFAHGFQTLEPNCQILYLHTEYHSSESEGGFRYDSESLGIKWPLPACDLSLRDQGLPVFEKNFRGIDI